MAVNCCPLGPKPQFLLSTGLPAVGGQLFMYVAGSVGTKQNTYTTSAGSVANANPIVLNALGEPSTEIWFTAGQTYKVVYAPSTDTDPPTSPIWTIDNLLGINDTTSSQSEWVSGPAPTFISVTSFSLVGDQTAAFTVGRRLKTTNTSGTIYSTITVSAFAVVTTITVVNDSGVLDSGLSAVSYGLLQASNPSIPSTAFDQPTVTVASATTTNLKTAGARSVIISGTTAITAITLSNGQEASIEFSGVLTLTNSASLILPGGANITTTAGDTAIVRGEAANVVRFIQYTQVGVKPASTGSFTITLTGFTATITGTAVYSITNNVVTLFIPVLTGTSNATTMTATGLPAAITPTTNHLGLLIGAGQDNGGNLITPVRCDVASTGVISFFTNASSGSAWTNVNAKGLAGGATLTYNLN